METAADVVARYRDALLEGGFQVERAKWDYDPLSYIKVCEYVDAR